MNPNEDTMMSAYLDGELSAREAAEFDRQLTAFTRRRLQGEMTLENAIGDALRADASCPDVLWQELLDRVEQRASHSRRMGRWVLPVGLAALLALGTAWAALWYQGLTPEFLVPLQTVAGTEMDVTPERVNALFEALGLDVTMQSVDVLKGHDRRAELLGAREVRYKDTPVVQIFYECCGKPLTLVIARQDTAGAEAIRRAAAEREVGPVRLIGNTVATTVGKHSRGNLIDVLQARPKQA
jgi:hypothetical protein